MKRSVLTLLGLAALLSAGERSLMFKPDLDREALVREALVSAFPVQPDEPKTDPYAGLPKPLARALMSVFIPGLSQFLYKDYIWAGSLLAAEVSFGTAKWYYTDQGNQIMDDSYVLANKYWSWGRYRDFLLHYGEETRGTNPFKNDASKISAWEEYIGGPNPKIDEVIKGGKEYYEYIESGLSYSHHISLAYNDNGEVVVRKELDFWEEIGKYDQFNAGWNLGEWDDPADPALVTEATPERKAYLDHRDKANQNYKYGDVMVGMMIVTHMVSAVHALIQTKQKNDQIIEERANATGFRFQGKLDYADGQLIRGATLSYGF